MKTFFLTMDLEEWYHLDYFKKYNLVREKRVVSLIYDFLNILDKNDIKITVFVLGELVKENSNILKEIKNRGHSIGCHGYNHELLNKKTGEEFKEDILRAKHVIEDLINMEVIGYRAACFTMDREKLMILRECGYKYDSSMIRFDQHPLYKSLDIADFQEIDDLVYKKDNFYEFEVPTYKILKRNIPISGGGYFRFLPLPIFKYLFKQYSKMRNNFVFYIHPFEVTNIQINLGEEVHLKDKFRFSYGRKNNLYKFEKFIVLCKKEGYIFDTFSNYIKGRESEG